VRFAITCTSELPQTRHGNSGSSNRFLRAYYRNISLGRARRGLRRRQLQNACKRNAAVATTGSIDAAALVPGAHVHPDSRAGDGTCMRFNSGGSTRWKARTVAPEPARTVAVRAVGRAHSPRTRTRHAQRDFGLAMKPSGEWATAPSTQRGGNRRQRARSSAHTARPDVGGLRFPARQLARIRRAMNF